MSLSPITYRESAGREGKIAAATAGPSIMEPIRSLETSGFVLTERVHAPNWVFPNHAHESTIIGIILKGFYTETIGSHSQECGTHSLQFLPAGECHSYKFGAASVLCLSVEIKSQKLEEIRQFSRIADQPIYIGEGMMSALVVRLHKEFRRTDSLAALMVEGLVFEMLGTASRRKDRDKSTRPPRWLRQARDFINENAMVGVSLLKLAALVGVHPTYLARMFRKFYGCSVGDYIRRLRLDYAIRELTKSDKTIAEIASAAGYYDQSHLTHLFKFQTGMTPAEFRAAVRK